MYIDFNGIFKFFLIFQNMNSKDLNFIHKRKHVNSKDLKHRLFEKGIGQSLSSLKSPLSADSSDNLLFVNLGSAQYQISYQSHSKISPKVGGRKPFGNLQSVQKKNYFLEDRVKNDDLSKQNIKTQMKTYTSGYSNCKGEQARFERREQSRESAQFRRTRVLMEKLSGKAKRRNVNNFIDKSSKEETIVNESQLQNSSVEEKKMSNHSSPTSSPKKQIYQEELTLENYIKQALKNTPNIQEFLYLVNSKYLKANNYDGEEDPYDLEIINYNETKKVEQKFAPRYYTISKKGFCYYINGKPVEFIDLDEWVQQKQNYNKIKNLKFFNRFRKWKTIKMWRKVVLKHRLEECSKNLEERLFFLNSVMRRCLFQVQQISIRMGKSIMIINKNQGDYSLDNFKLIQEKTKRQNLSTIEEFSRMSRDHVKSCFDENIKQLRSSVKEKQELDEKVTHQTTYLNAKDSAFQELGFPPKMSYENRSKLRKMAGSFIRFSYLVDMIYSAGLASSFQTQIGSFIQKLHTLQYNEKVEVIMIKEENKQNQEDEIEKMFNVKLCLQKKEIQTSQMKIVNFKTDDASCFYPIYHIRTDNEVLQEKRKYIPDICEQWLQIKPNFEDIYDEISSHLKEGLNCLKNFQRWSKHREMEKYINILEEWDDVVSESRQIAENDNLDPIAIVKNFQTALSALKEVTTDSLIKINQQIKLQLTEYLNIHWEHQQIVIQKLKDRDLSSPAETIELFLKYMTEMIKEFEKKIPYKIGLGVFEVNLASIKFQLVEKLTNIYEDFRVLLPVIVLERTEELNEWLKKYRSAMKEQVKNIDDFIRAIKYMKEIDAEFQFKKEMCQNLGHIYQTMEIYKFDTKKRKQFETITLKLKDQLEQLINIFEQTYDRKSELYSREVMKIHLPNLIKDISRLSQNISHLKYLRFPQSGKENQILKDIKHCQEKYSDLEKKKQLCQQYKQVLNLINTDIEELDELKLKIQARRILWEEFSVWDEKLREINEIQINKIDLEETSNFIYDGIKIIKKLQENLPENQVLNTFIKMVQILSKNIPIITGIRGNVSECHWEEITEITSKISTINLRQRENIKFKDFVESQIGKQHESFQHIFVRASEESKLQCQYENLQKKWESTFIKVKLDIKYHLIADENEKKDILNLFDHTLSTITTILSSTYSSKIKISFITYEYVLHGYNIFTRWIDVQEKLIQLEKICKSLDTKKLSEYGMLENAEKSYKVILKYLLGRNVESSFKLTKLTTPSVVVDDKLQECEQSLNLLEENIHQLFNENCRSFPLFYQFTNKELLKIFTDTNHSANISFVIKRLIPVVDNLEFDSERITKIITKDGDNMIKTPISTTTQLEQIIEQIIQSISDTCRKMMRSCRVKNMESSLIQIIDEYNIQFLLAVGKVDFSHYTAISIENGQDNSDSLKDYLKILRKDTNEGIVKLKSRQYQKRAVFQAFETILLQNLVHQQILDKLVNKNILCSNDYEWVKQLRFIWEDNGLDETNISVRQIQISLRYGQQYIGSSSKVILNSDFDVLVAMKYSEICTYHGYSTSFKEFIEAIGHKFVVFKCEGHHTRNSIKNLILSYSSTDCCFLFLNIQRLNNDISKILENREALLSNEKNTKKIVRQQSQVKYYSPIFLQISNSMCEKIGGVREKYRNVSFQTPSVGVIESYLLLLGEQHEFLSPFLKKIFFMLEYLEGYQGEKKNLNEFLNIIKNKNITEKEKIIQELLKYLESINKENHQLIFQTISNSYPTFYEEYKNQLSSEIKIQLSKREDHLPLQLGNKVIILRGKQQCMDNFVTKIQNKVEIQLNGYDESQLYGNPDRYGILDHIIKNIPQQQNYIKNSYLYQQLSKKNLEENDEITLVIFGINNRLIKYLSEYKQKKTQNKIIVCVKENLLSEKNGYETLALSQLIDPKILLNFKIIDLKITEAYIDEKVEEWIEYNFKQIQNTSQIKQSEKSIKGDSFLTDEERIKKFYNFHFKYALTLWFANENQSDKLSKVTTFLNILEILLPTNNIKEAMVYAMIWAFKETIGNDYIKLEILVKKIMGDDGLVQDISLFDYMFLHDGKQGKNLENQKYPNFCEEKKYKLDRLVPIKQYINDHYDQQRIINRGQYFLTETIIHYQVFCERVYEKGKKQIHLIGAENSGKSAFIEIFKEHFCTNTAFLTLYTSGKSSSTICQKVKSVLAMHDLKTMKSKLNYGLSFIVVEDMNLEINNKNEQEKCEVLSYLKTMIKYGKFFDKGERRHYKVQNVNFMLSSRKNINIFDDCTIKLVFNNQKQIQTIFSQILKANLLDSSELSESFISKLISGAFNIFDSLVESLESSKQKNRKKPKLLNISLIKNMCIFVSHLRYKEATPMNIQLERFWTFMLNENFAVICRNFIDSKITLTQLIDNNGFKSYKSNPNAMYSHLHVKQQKYGHGKQLQIVKDIKKVYNIVNEKIEKYNQSEIDSRKYGYSFEFISVDEMLNKVIKISNNLIYRDYGIYGRKGSDCRSIIKLTAYLLGFNFREIKKNQVLVDNIRDVIPEVTKVSSFLISMRITQDNYKNFINFYDLDFGSQVIGRLSNRQILNKIKNMAVSTPSNFNQKLNKSQTMLKANTVSCCSTNQNSKNSKMSYKDIKKIRKSIKLIFEFTDKSHLLNLPKNVKEMMTFDLIEEFPEESVVRFSKEILELSELSYNEEAMLTITEIYRHSRQKLGISIKEFEDCIRLYSSFVLALPEQLKSKIKKLTQVIELCDRLNQSVVKLNKESEDMWEQKKFMAAKIQKTKQELRNKREEGEEQNENEEQGSVQLEELQQKLGTLNENLQGKIELKCQCQKIIGYLEETVEKYKLKREKIQKYSKDTKYLEQTLAVVSSYFTFLSKLKHVNRQQYLEEWNREIKILRQISQGKKLTHISEIFNISREEEMINFSHEENQQFYDNMTIILESVKPIIIRDDGFRGRKWLKQFDESFVTIEETRKDFYEKLSKYLAQGHNILLELSKEETFQTLQTSFINSLIYMSENTPTVEVNGEEVCVSKESKVYIVVDSKLKISEELENQFLIVTYEEHSSHICANLQNDLLAKLHTDKYFFYMQTKKKITDLVNDCEKIEIAIVEALWSHFYGEEESKEEEEEEKKEEERESKIMQKSDEEFLEQVWNFRKDISDRIQALTDKIKFKKKIKKQFEQKSDDWKPTTPEIVSFNKNVSFLYQLLKIFENKFSYVSPELNEFYEIIKAGINYGFIDNISTLIIFSLKQWGRRFTKKDVLVFLFLFLHHTEEQSLSGVQDFILFLQGNKRLSELKSTFLFELAQLKMLDDVGFDEEVIEDYLVDKLINISLSIPYENLLGLQMNEKYPFVKIKKTFKISGIQKFCPCVIVLTGFSGQMSVQKLKTQLNKSDSLVEVKNLDNLEIQLKKLIFVEKSNILINQNKNLINKVLEEIFYKGLTTDDNIPEDFNLYICSNQPEEVQEIMKRIVGSSNLLYVLNIKNKLNFLNKFFHKKCPFLLQSPNVSHKQSQEVTQKNIMDEKAKSKKTITQSFKSYQNIQNDEEVENSTVKILMNYIDLYLLSEFYDFFGQEKKESVFSAIYSQNFLKNIFQINQPLAAENETWNIFKTFQTIIVFIKEYFNKSDKISVRNKRQIRQYLQVIEKSLKKFQEQTINQNEEEFEDSIGESITNKILFHLRIVCQEQQNKLKQKTNIRQNILREAQFIFFKNDWLYRLKMAIYSSQNLFVNRQRITRNNKVRQILADLQNSKKSNFMPQQNQGKRASKRMNNFDRNSQKIKNMVSNFMKGDETEQFRSDEKAIDSQAKVLHYNHCLRYLKIGLLEFQLLILLLEKSQRERLSINNKENIKQYINQILQKQGLVPANWNYILNQFFDETGSLYETLKNTYTWKRVMIYHQQKLQKGPISFFDFELLPRPVFFIKNYLKTDFYECNKTEYSFYLVQNVSMDQLNSPFTLKFKTAYAKGWRLSNEGTLEILNDDKINLLRECFIVKRFPMAQLTTCEVNIVDEQNGDPRQCFSLKVHVYSKKNQGHWKGNMFFKRQ